MEHPQRENMLLAADNADQLFECIDREWNNSPIRTVMQYPELNWRPVKTAKKIKRWLWADKDGFATKSLYSDDEINAENEQRCRHYTIKLLWSETIFEE